MKELDLTLAGIANSNTKAGMEHARKEALEEFDRVLATVDQAKREKAIHHFCENSIQDKNYSKKKQIHGKTYVGKKAFYMAIAVAGVILTSKVVEITSEVSEYNRILNQKMESELNHSEQALYQEEHKNPILNAIDAYQQIKEEKENLNSEHYNFLGENIQDNHTTYLPFDERSSFNLSEKSQDAIDMATDQVISEYQGRGK